MASGDSALNLVISITAMNGASAVINQVAQSLSSLAGGGAMGAIATAAVAAGAAVVGIGASAAKSAGDFQQSMSQLITSAGEAKSNIQSVSDGILKMSVDTGTSTQQLGSAMYYVESSGQHGAAALQELTAAAQGAKTENADLTTVTKALTTVMTDYHLPVQDSTAAMNGLIAIVKNGRTNLQDLSSSMGAVLPIASSLGISFPQVGGAMDVMTNAGLSSQQAAQNLAHVLVALQAPSKVAQSSMQEVGLSAQQVKDALVSQGLPEAFQMIEDHVSKKFPAGSVQAETALKNILGGLVGLKTAAMFTGDSLQTAEQDVKNITDAFDHAGSAVDGWDTVQQNFNFQLDRAQAALNAFMIVLGQQLLPILTPIVKGFADLVSGISNFIGSLGNAKDPGDAFVKTLSSLGINAQTARDIFNDLSTAFHIIGDIATNVGNILQTTFGTAFKIAGGLVIAFINGPLDDIIQGFNAVLSGIDDFTKNLSQNLQTTFDGLSSDAETWGQNFMIGFENGIIAIASDIIAVVEQVAQDIADYLGFGSPTKKGPGSTLNSWGRGMMTGLAQGITAASPIVVDAVTGVAAQLQQAATSGGTLHSAVASMIDPTSGDAMTASVTPDKTVATTTATTTAKSTATSGLTAVASAVTKSTTAITSAIAHSTATTAAAVSTAATKVASCSSPASSCATKAAEAAKAQKAASSAASTKQRATLASQAAQQRKEAAAQRQAAAQQRAQQHAEAVKQRQTAAQQRAQQHTEAQAKREQIRQELAQQRAEAKAAKAAAKAGPPAVGGATPIDWTKALKPITDINTEANKLNTTFQNISKNAKLMADNISTSFTGVQAKAQQIAADLKPFGDWLQRTFAPVWQQLSDTWENHIVPDLAKIKQSLDPAIPSFKLIFEILGQLIGLAVIAFFQQVAVQLQAVAWLIGQLADAATYWIQQWLQIQQQLQPVYQWIVDGLQWVYDQIIGHSIIPDLVNGIKNWFNQLVDFFPNVMGRIKSTLVQWWNQIKTDVTTFWQSVGSIFSSAYQTWIAKPLASMSTAFSTWWNTQKAAWTTFAKNLWAAVQGIFNGAYATQLAPALVKIGQSFSTWFTQEATQFATWATNLLKMFGQGISTGLAQYVQPAINTVAQAIQNVLGIFSPAKMGPLSTSNQWMPNMMKMMASGINSGTSAVTNGVNSMASSVQNSMSSMTSNVGNSASQMKAQLQSVGEDIANMQSRVSAAINQAKAQMQTATSEITANITAERNLISQTIGYLANQMNAMGQTIQKVENQANQATSAVNSDLQNTNSASKAVQVNLDLSNAATKAAWQDYLNAVSAAKQSMSAEGISTQAQSKALQAAIQAGNNAYTAALAQGKSQADALKADQNAFQTSIKASESQTNAQSSTKSAQTANTNAQTSTAAAQTSQQAAKMSGIQKFIADQFATLAGGAAYIAVSDATHSKTSAQIAQSDAMNASEAASQSMTSAGMSTAQQALAQTAATGAYTSAYDAAIAHGQSAQQADQAGVSAFNASIKASEAGAHAQQAGSSANTAGTSAQQAASSAQQATAGAKTATAGSNQAQQSAATAVVSTKSVTTSLKSSDNTLDQVQADQQAAAAAAKAMIAMAMNAAAQVHALMGIFSPSKEGPLSTSDQWMPNLMNMFMEGLNSKQSALKNASTIAAQGVKDAFQDAATVAGASLVSLKQKGDDIYATIAALTGGTPGTGGIPGTAAQYALETANVRGDIPIQYMITPPTPGTPGTSGTSTTQNMTVHIDLDGKTIGKYVGKYVSKEIHVQGAVRNS